MMEQVALNGGMTGSQLMEYSKGKKQIRKYHFKSEVVYFLHKL